MLVVCCFSPNTLIGSIVLTGIAFIFETAAWANWAHEVGNNDVDYGVCFVIAVLVWCLLLLLLLLLIFCYLTAAGYTSTMGNAKDGLLPTPVNCGIGALAGLVSILIILALISSLHGSDSDSWNNLRWWMAFLLVLATVCSCVGCCVLAMLGKRRRADDSQKREREKNGALSTLIIVGIGALAALIVILLLLAIVPFDNDVFSGAKEWNKGTTTVAPSIDRRASVASSVGNYSYQIGLFETNVKHTSTTCCDADGNSIETTYSDVTSDNSGKTKDAGEAACALIACAIILVLVAVMLVVCCFSPNTLIGSIVLTGIAFIFETAAWANWAHEVGNNDVDYGVCFVIAVLVWCLLLLLLLLLIFAYFCGAAGAPNDVDDDDGAADGVSFIMDPNEKQRHKEHHVELNPLGDVSFIMDKNEKQRHEEHHIELNPEGEQFCDASVKGNNDNIVMQNEFSARAEKRKAKQRARTDAATDAVVVVPTAPADEPDLVLDVDVALVPAVACSGDKMCMCPTCMGEPPAEDRAISI